MPTMNVSLTPELAKFVEGEVASGDYGTASEVVRAALRLLARDREIYQEKLEILRREGQRGSDQSARGELPDNTNEGSARGGALGRGRTRGGRDVTLCRSANQARPRGPHPAWNVEGRRRGPEAPARSPAIQLGRRNRPPDFWEETPCASNSCSPLLH